jgi:hypothetical protein
MLECASRRFTRKEGSYMKRRLSFTSLLFAISVRMGYRTGMEEGNAPSYDHVLRCRWYWWEQRWGSLPELMY